jgi:hypothetical protein
MGLLDKAGGASEDVKKPVAKAVAKAKPVAKAVAKAAPVKAAKVAKAARPKKEKTARVKKARPIGLSEDYELSTDMNRRISWLVNFIVNFGVLFAAIFISLSDTGIITTILFAAGMLVIIINVGIIPTKFSRNIGQFVSRTKFVRGDGSNPNKLHGLLVNSVGILALVGIIMIFIQFQALKEADNTTPIIMFSLGTIFVIVWFVDRYLKNGSEMRQGLFDLMFGAFLVKYVPADDEKATGIWARLENMGNFGDQLVKKTEERKAKKVTKAETSSEEEPTTEKEDK